MLTVRIS